MAKEKAQAPEVLFGGKREGPDRPSYQEFAGAAMSLVGLGVILASLLDIGILWLTQRVPGVNFEFVALQNTTTSGLFNLLLGTGFLIGGLGVRESRSQVTFRVIGILSVVTGLFAALVAVLMVSNYFALVGTVGVTEENLNLVRGSVVKTVGLAGMYTLIFCLLGVGALRGGRK